MKKRTDYFLKKQTTALRVEYWCFLEKDMRASKVEHWCFLEKDMRTFNIVDMAPVHFVSSQYQTIDVGSSKCTRWPTSSMSASTLGISRYCIAASYDALGKEVSF